MATKIKPAKKKGIGRGGARPNSGPKVNPDRAKVPAYGKKIFIWCPQELLSAIEKAAEKNPDIQSRAGVPCISEEIRNTLYKQYLPTKKT